MHSISQKICKENYEEINLHIKDENGEIAGGINSVFCWNWIEVDILWVDDRSGAGSYGSRLLQEIERIAREKKCTFIKLNTFSFQAPLFYQKHGFQEIASYRRCPKRASALLFDKAFGVETLSRVYEGRSWINGKAVQEQAHPVYSLVKADPIIYSKYFATYRKNVWFRLSWKHVQQMAGADDCYWIMSDGIRIAGISISENMLGSLFVIPPLVSRNRLRLI